jgi:peptidyl-prolyl cis-trans isomerase B (cyclophilin B)
MKYRSLSLVAAGLLAALLLSCSPRENNAAAQPTDTPAGKEAAARAEAPVRQFVVVLKTTEGDMVVECWPAEAPGTVENFFKLAMSGFYDGTAFHRIIDGYMIQGGDPLTKDPAQEARWGTGSAPGHIKAEQNNRKHEFGIISMARAGNPDSASSQFFICLGPAPKLDGNFTAFGKVIKGEDVLKKIGATPCGPGPTGENSKPLTRVGLESVKIVPADSIK